MPYLIKSPFLNEHNVKTIYNSTDSFENFKINCKNLGPKWIWANKPIVYKFNSFGYRMEKELNEIDFDSYLAFFGCSFTTGVGLPLEETFSYRISKTLKIDYINGAIGGSSVDFAFYNIIHLLSSAPKNPKAIIINWPDISRTFYWHNNFMDFYLANVDVSDKFWKNAYKLFIIEDSHMNNRFHHYRQVLHLLCKSLKIKLFEFTFIQSNLDEFLKTHSEVRRFSFFDSKFGPKPNGGYDLEHLNKFCARDINPKSLNKNNLFTESHPGVHVQQNVEKEFLSWYNNYV
jgi:hypothetical protein